MTHTSQFAWQIYCSIMILTIACFSGVMRHQDRIFGTRSYVIVGMVGHT